MVAPPAEKGRKASFSRGSISMLPGGKAAGRLMKALGEARGTQALEAHKVWICTADGVPILQIPNGPIVSIVRSDTLCIQMGPIFTDSFGTEWLPVSLVDDTVGFTPIALRKFIDGIEDVTECWANVTTPGLNRASKILPHNLTVPSGPLPSQGFMHGFQLQADLEDKKLGVNRRGSIGRIKWNLEWQTLMEEAIPYDDMEALSSWRNRVGGFYLSFTTAAAAAVQAIVTEQIQAEQSDADASGSTPPPQRTIHPLGGIGGELLYLSNGMLFSVCSENVGQGRVFKTPTAARRYAGLEVRHAALLHKVRSGLLSAPLCCTVTYMGRRVFCIALLPISPSSMVLGSIDGGKTYVTECRTGPLPASYTTAITALGENLGLASHSVSATESSVLPIDVQVHAGGDGRVYLTNLGRLMPAAIPLSGARKADPQRLMHKVFRPEALAMFPDAVSADAFSLLEKFDNGKGGHDAARCTQYTRTHLCEAVSKVLSELSFPCELAVPQMTCVDCSSPAGQPGTPRFSQCLAGCCWICVECYLRYWETDTEPTPHCSSLTRTLTGMPMKPSVTEVLHHYGVNLRYMGIIYCSLTGYRAAVQQYLKVEMLGRGFKGLMWGKLGAESTQGVMGHQNVVASMLKKLLAGGGRPCEDLWRELGKAVSVKFSLHNPFPTADVDPVLLVEKVASLCGLSITKEGLAALLKSGKLPSQTVTFAPVVKGFDIDNLAPLPVHDSYFDTDPSSARHFWTRHLATSSFNDPFPPHLTGLVER